MFNQILGQEKPVKQLKKFAASGRVPQALLFCGTEGVGKALSAKNFAMALNCADDAARAAGDCCGVCQNCQNILNGTHPDYIFADLNYQAQLLGKDGEKKQHILVDTIRNVTAKSQQKAAFGRYKVIIIDKAQTMLGEAANALLKFIEEPPPGMVWILISSRKDSMLPTIRSRCQTLHFNDLTPELTGKILNSKGYDGAAAARAAKHAGGSASRAVSVMEFFETIATADASKETFPYETAASLDKTLAAAREQAGLILDISARALHALWKNAKDEKTREELKEKLEKNAFYKKAARRNVSPQLIIETALMETEKFNKQIFG